MSDEFMLIYTENGNCNYGFFESEDELRDFVKEHPQIKVVDAFQFRHVADIEGIKKD